MSVQVIAPPAADEPSRRRGRACVSSGCRPRRRGRGHFSLVHPLAKVAERLCKQCHELPFEALTGGVACGSCWEVAVRADERVMFEYKLPPLLGDHTVIDEIAIERVIRGERIRLTRTEKAAAVVLLAERGRTVGEVARLLRMSGATVAELWPTPAATAGAGRQAAA